MYNAYDRPHRDLRELLERAEVTNELVTINGVDWNLEMGALTELIHHARPNPPAILLAFQCRRPRWTSFAPIETE